MGMDDLFDKAKEAVSSEQGEEISDNLIEGAEDLANKATGGKFTDQVEGIGDAIDGKIGNE